MGKSRCLPKFAVGVGGPPPQAGHQSAQVHLTVDLSSTSLFAVNNSQNLVIAFRIGSDGSLTPTGSANGTSSPGSSPCSLATTSSFVYFGDFSQAKLYGYGYTNGMLTPTPGSPYANVMTPAYFIKGRSHRTFVIRSEQRSRQHLGVEHRSRWVTLADRGLTVLDAGDVRQQSAIYRAAVSGRRGRSYPGVARGSGRQEQDLKISTVPNPAHRLLQRDTASQHDGRKELKILVLPLRRAMPLIFRDQQP